MATANFESRTLYHRDNLEVLRGMNSGTIDLIATDPPFNKSRDFYATPDSLAKGARFEDRWSWDKDVHPEWVDAIKDDWPAVWAVVESARVSAGEDMAAFLCWLGVRLMECHRVLKDTGSLYLHIDHTAHAYAKCLLDSIFGRRNFRNEIVWFYRTGGASKRTFAKKHDTILFYSKSDTYKFDLPLEKSYLTGQLKHSAKNETFTDKWGAYQNILFSATLIKLYKDQRGYYTLTGCRDYWNIDAVGRTGKERTGYPTQKPLALYERIIEASSNEGDLVLDPFCGCATTPVAAQRLRRDWVGIDVWDGAYKTVLERLQKEYLNVPGLENDRMSLEGEVHYKTEPPLRTDYGEATPVPDLQLKVQRPPEPWEKLSHAQMTDILNEAQSTLEGVICAGCGRVLEREFMELDQITPKADRGANHILNRILLCRPCNGRKRNYLTLGGLIRENKRQTVGWMKNETLAKLAQDKARERAEQVRNKGGV